MFRRLVSVLIAALAATSALAQTTHTIVVGQNSTKTFTPNNITAALGDIVNFQFVAGNHTATQSTFGAPCTAAGFKSGFKPANATNSATFSILVNSTDPIWVYCAQQGHCAAGMVMSINAATTGNKTFADFQAAAIGIAGTATGTSVSGSAAASGTAGATAAGGASAAASSTVPSGTSTSASASASPSSAAEALLPPLTGLSLVLAGSLGLML